MVLLGYAEDSVAVEVSGDTIGGCIDDAVRQLPIVKKGLFDEDGKLLPDNLFIVNGEGVLENVLTRVIKDGDKIEIIRYEGG
jgi:sulfur carrier protein ThiS